MKSRQDAAASCIHFTGLLRKSCEADIAYADARVDGVLPCIAGGVVVPCVHRQYPTPEQIAAEVMRPNSTPYYVWNILEASYGIRAAEWLAAERAIRTSNAPRWQRLPPLPEQTA